MTTDPLAALAEAMHDNDDVCNANAYIPFAECPTGEYDIEQAAKVADSLRALGWRLERDSAGTIPLALAATPPAIDPEAERAYVNNYISGRDAALRSALIARVGDAVGRNAAADIVDAAWRAALAAAPPAIDPERIEKAVAGTMYDWGVDDASAYAVMEALRAALAATPPALAGKRAGVDYPLSDLRMDVTDEEAAAFMAAIEEQQAPPAIDPERLARALHRVTVEQPGLLSDADMLNDPKESDSRPVAAAIIAAYEADADA